MRYWSTTHKQWQTLILRAHALTGTQTGRRQDFQPDEMQEGKSLYFEQADNLSGKAIYRMDIIKIRWIALSSRWRMSASCVISS
jgi:hypothetical protein